MIAKQDILDRATAWSLRPNVVEKDYVLGWLLAGLSRIEEVRKSWVFKGGTCLKKCYFETHRFSEDLDFTLRAGARYTKDELLEVLREAARETHELSGLDFQSDGVRIDEKHNKQNQATFKGKIPYKGPIGDPNYANILFDFTIHEVLVDDTDDREPFHPYPDGLPEGTTITAYSIEELFAEKTRALLERARPRDLYDVVNIVENHGDDIDFDIAREIFGKKCQFKSLAVPTHQELHDRVIGSDDIVQSWESMLGHQLQVLPPLPPILERLLAILEWVNTPAPAPVVSAEAPTVVIVPHLATAGSSAAPLFAPPSSTYWQGSGPIEQLRFAGANRLMISFSYKGKQRLAEPYSLRRSKDDNILLYAWEGGQIKAFSVAEIAGLSVTTQPYTPRFAVELTGTMIPSVRSSGGGGARPRRTRRTRSSTSGRTYVYRCSWCDREFKHERQNSTLKAHQNRRGYPCSGRHGYLERIDW